MKKTFLLALQRGEMAAHYENPIRAKSGQERFIRFSNTLLRDAQGNVIGTTSLGEDITERKRAEAALTEAQRQTQETLTLFKTLLDNAPVGLSLVALLVLVYEFALPLLVAGIIALGVFIIVDNLRELAG